MSFERLHRRTIVFFVVVLIYTVVATCLTGCEESKTVVEDPETSSYKRISFKVGVKIEELDGHKYLIFFGDRWGEVVHSLSCDCLPETTRFPKGE